MRKNSFLFLLSLFAYQADAQVLYLETFDNIPGPTAGGAGTYTFPTNMLLRNVDGLAQDAGVIYVNNAWIRREDFANNVADSCAFSTSWYSPVGVANDFMWTPMIAIPAGTTNLTWNALSYDPLFPDGYEVRVMAGTAPTGGTGVIGNQLTNSTVVFNTVAENTTWTARTVDVSAYAGQNIYIGFRNNSNNQFLLLIDDIKVETLNLYDASVTAAISSEYTQIPVGQGSIPLGGTVSNIGANALTNVALTANVYNSLNVLVHSATATSVASIAVGANAAFTMPDFTPTLADVYTIKYNHVQTEVDPVTANDEFTKTMAFTTNVFARDNGTVVGGLGIGAGNGGYIGQSFTLTNPAYLYSITAFYNKGYLANERYASAIWNTNVGGVPTTILATTDTMTYPNQSSILTTTPIFGGNILLPAGTYVVTAIEFDSTVQLGTTDEIFTVGKHWVNWPTTPLGGWGNIESFGATFMKALAIRMNIGATAFPLPSEALILKGKSSELHHELSWSNLENATSKYEYVLQRSDDAKTWSDVYETSSIGQDKISSFTTIDTKSIRPKSYYRVRVKNQDNELKYSNMITLFNNSKELLVDIYPNPTNGVLNFNLNNFKNTTMSLYDIQGKVVLTKQLTEANNTISLQGISAGVYQIKLANSNTIIYQDNIIIQ
jgi:hypothetical protein